MRIVLAIPFILSFFPVMFCAGQKSIGGRIDTFALAKELRNDREYGESVRLMYQYLKAHPGDVNALWYNGQTELWRGRFRKSRSLYQQASSLRPDDDYLLLDYANTLAVTGKWNQAGDVLDQLRARGVNYSDAYLIRANLAYWGANYEHALRYVDSALALDPANNTARDLQVQIQNTRAPWVELTSAYSTDNQPVQALATSVRAGTFINRFLIPSLHLEAPLYWRNGMSTGIYKIDIANEMNFSQAGIKVALGAGMAHFESTDANEWTGALAVQQRWGRLGWQMAVDRKPYTYTITSIDTALIFTQFRGNIGWYDQSGPEGRLAAELSALRNSNTVYSVYGWVFTGPTKFFVFDVRLGYSYSYSDSRESSFISPKTLGEIIDAYDQPVSGIYYLFFTPEQQSVHSALLQAHSRPNNGRWSGGFNVDLGIVARAQNPYLYLDKDEHEQLFVNRGFASEKFSPFGISLFSLWQLTDKVSLSARYEYRQAWFFNVHTVGLGLKIHLWNELK